MVQQHRNGIATPEYVRTAVTAMIKQVGIVETARKLAISKTTVARICGGLEIQRPTIIAVACALGLSAQEAQKL